MIINLIIILTAVAIIAFAFYLIDMIRPRYCKECGTKMDRYFDIEEDAEVLQCPNCGRSYLLK